MIQKDAVAQSVGHAEIDRISVFGDGLQNGTCSLRIESITEEDFGTYACTLFDEAGVLLTGQVEIYAEGKSGIFWTCAGVFGNLP